MAQWALLMAGLAARSAAMELHNANWDISTGGKNVIVVFFQQDKNSGELDVPKAWPKFQYEINTGPESQHLVAGIVNCGSEKGIPLCVNAGMGPNEGVKLPQIRYGDPSVPRDMKWYDDAAEFEDLRDFADQNFQPVCGPKFLNLCDDEETKAIKLFQSMSDQKLTHKIQMWREQLEEAEQALDDLGRELIVDLNTKTQGVAAKAKDIQDEGLTELLIIQQYLERTKQEL